MSEEQPQEIDRLSGSRLDREAYTYSFRMSVFLSLERLKECREKGEDWVTLGPVYEVVSSGGDEISVSTIVMKGDEERGYLFVGIDKAGNVVGLRRSDLKFDDRTGSLVDSGRLDVGVKGKGYGSGLELAPFKNGRVFQNSLGKGVPSLRVTSSGAFPFKYLNFVMQSVNGLMRLRRK